MLIRTEAEVGIRRLAADSSGNNYRKSDINGSLHIQANPLAGASSDQASIYVVIRLSWLLPLTPV